MRFLASRAVFLLILTLAFSSPGSAATLGTASLQGNYSFVLHKLETSVAVGFSFTSAVGTIAFDGNGAVTVQGSINRSADFQGLNAAGTYTLDPKGVLQISIPNVASALSGSVSFDLNSLLVTNVEGPNALSQEVLLATRLPAQPLTPASLSGRYFLVQRTVRATSLSPELQSSFGTITFDGVQSYSLEETANSGGLVLPRSSSGSYQVTGQSTVSLTLSSPPGSVTLAFAPEAAFAVGTTVSQVSSSIHNLFVLLKADTAGLGNPGLGGAFQMAVSGVDSIEGFSTSAGRALFFGDGRAFYELQRKRTGAVEAAGGNSTVEVATNGAAQFSGIPDVTGVLQGGLGLSVRSLAAAEVTDPAVHNVLIAIRTPAAPSAAANAASFLQATALSPGALFSLFGTNLARQTVLASSLPLPQQMGGATVKVNGIEAPLHFVSPFQINAQVPFEVSPGTAEITVALDGAEGSSLSVPVNPAGPGMFTRSLDGQGPGIFLHGSNFTLVTESSPARPGEVILIYGTGFGSVVPSVPSGAAAPGDPLANVTGTVTVQIGGRDAPVSFAGLAPGFVGLYQLNVRIPPETSPASNVPVVVSIAGVPSNSVTIPVAP
jgi:uncharacterized protein (TIGR03437 family)